MLLHEPGQIPLQLSMVAITESQAQEQNSCDVSAISSFRKQDNLKNMSKAPLQVKNPHRTPIHRKNLNMVYRSCLVQS